MAQIDILRRYLEAGAEFGQMTRERAESIIKDLVRAGEVQMEQTQERIDELVEWRRRNTDHLKELVRREINSQLSALGLATKADLAALERKLASGAARAAKKTATKKSPAKKKSPARKAAKKTVAKKTVAKKTAGKKTAARKATGRG